MDGYDGAGYGVGGEGFNFNDPTWVDLRRNMGFIVQMSRRFDLHRMLPTADTHSVSSGYALADPQSGRYIIYLPETNSGRVTVDLGASRGTLRAEWLDPANGRLVQGQPARGGGRVDFSAPFDGDAVLMLEPQSKPASAS